MEYYQTITLKDGATCVLRNSAEKDGPSMLDFFLLTHGQTDFLLSYPDETDETGAAEPKAEEAPKAPAEEKKDELDLDLDSLL